VFAPSGFGILGRTTDDQLSSGFASWALEPTTCIRRVSTTDATPWSPAAGDSGEIYFGEDPEGLAAKRELDR